VLTDYLAEEILPTASPMAMGFAQVDVFGVAKIP
jgi:hypothetical protein